MVGLVLVSHSMQLAQGLRDLIAQMSQGQVPVAIAAGVDDPQNPLGTDAMRVLEAIQALYSEDGVLVLTDLGSALLSAETAIEFLPPEQQPHICLSQAPLVEGALAAAVQAAAGQNLEAVEAEARQGMAGKIAHLANAAEGAAPATPAPEALPGKTITLTIHNRYGLHARPAARFVRLANRFRSDITVRNLMRELPPVNAKSINHLATLGVRQGGQIVVSASGPDANAALQALTRLVETDFGQEDQFAIPQPPPRPAAESFARPVTPGRLQGIPLSSGFVLAPSYVYQPAKLAFEKVHAEDPDFEANRLRAAIAKAKEALERLASQAQGRLGQGQATIFEAHLLFLEDPFLVERAYNAIRKECLAAEGAWQATFEAIAADYEALDDPYQRARAADVRDVGQRVLRSLVADQMDQTTEVRALRPSVQPCILLAADLTPSEVAELDLESVRGLCTAYGTATSHSAILACSLGIPAVIALGEALLDTPDGTLLGLDAETGQVYLDPPANLRKRLKTKAEAWKAEQRAALEAAQQPAITRDGHRVDIFANINALAEAAVAVRQGAEGVGVLRTEFLYLDRQAAPTEEEHFLTYSQISEKLGGRTLVIRTLDIGGDKDLPYLDLPREANPFLGWRAIRISLGEPELFKVQLRSILRASIGRAVHIMLPMLTALEEIQQAKALLAEACGEIEARGEAIVRDIPFGIMIEVPSAAILADQFVRQVDFVSIGTNDLTQYTMAAERTNEKVAYLYDACHPAVLRQIHNVVQEAHAAGIRAAVCGELAADPEVIPILLGMGLDELSMAPNRIPSTKALIRSWSYQAAQALAQEVLTMGSADQVRRRVRSASQANSIGKL